MAGSSANWLNATRAQLSQSDLAIVKACRRHGLDEDGSLGLPSPAFLTTDIEEQFLFWRPLALPPGHAISISSSRLDQKLDEQPDWFDALRTVAVRISSEKKFLITAAGTTTDDFVRRCAELFHIPLVVLEPFPNNPSTDWFNQTVSNLASAAVRRKNEPLGRVPSPIVPPQKIFFKPLDLGTENPIRPNVNDVLIQSASTAVLLAVRANGNIEHAAQDRLKHQATPATWLLINSRLTRKSVESSLLDQGATGWWLGVPGETNETAVLPVTRPSDVPIFSPNEIDLDDYLIHYTRRRVGPWPDQTKREYLDDLIFQSGRRDHGEIAALSRILASRRILASNDLTRDRRPVVCFSNTPLDQILQQRVFRPHLSRWDFEPYGIAIDRKRLEQLGAHEVIYGTDSDWEELLDEQRPFFQLEKSRSDMIDWQLEREWRILGDLNLEQVSRDQAVVFVKTEWDARWIGSFSLWPVVVLET